MGNKLLVHFFNILGFFLFFFFGFVVLSLLSPFNVLDTYDVDAFLWLFSCVSVIIVYVFCAIAALIEDDYGFAVFLSVFPFIFSGFGFFATIFFRSII